MFGIFFVGWVVALLVGLSWFWRLRRLGFSLGSYQVFLAGFDAATLGFMAATFGLLVWFLFQGVIRTEKALSSLSLLGFSLTIALFATIFGLLGRSFWRSILPPETGEWQALSVIRRLVRLSCLLGAILGIALANEMWLR
jgi:hypothetical protein